MGWESCRKCGKLRKHGDYDNDKGTHVPACTKCGDPEYFEPDRMLENDLGPEVRDDDPPGMPPRKRP